MNYLSAANAKLSSGYRIRRNVVNGFYPNLLCGLRTSVMLTSPTDISEVMQTYDGCMQYLILTQINRTILYMTYESRYRFLC
jgi:hypothetical protein